MGVDMLTQLAARANLPMEEKPVAYGRRPSSEDAAYNKFVRTAKNIRKRLAARLDDPAVAQAIVGRKLEGRIGGRVRRFEFADVQARAAALEQAGASPELAERARSAQLGTEAGRLALMRDYLTSLKETRGLRNAVGAEQLDLQRKLLDIEKADSSGLRAAGMGIHGDLSAVSDWFFGRQPNAARFLGNLQSGCELRDAELGRRRALARFPRATALPRFDFPVSGRAAGYGPRRARCPDGGEQRLAGDDRPGDRRAPGPRPHEHGRRGQVHSWGVSRRPDGSARQLRR